VGAGAPGLEEIVEDRGELLLGRVPGLERIVVQVDDVGRTAAAAGGHLAEPHQVWTGLVDNAVSAMNDAGGQGTLTVRTARDHERLLVEFWRGPVPGLRRRGRARTPR
jgi:hypothetical protein